MAESRELRIRMSSQRVEALLEICDEMYDEFRPAGDHQRLLREFQAELISRLRDMLLRRQALYTLLLSPAQSLAFTQLWSQLDVSHDKYATIIISQIIQKSGAPA